MQAKAGAPAPPSPGAEGQPKCPQKAVLRGRRAATVVPPHPTSGDNQTHAPDADAAARIEPHSNGSVLSPRPVFVDVFSCIRGAAGRASGKRFQHFGPTIFQTTLPLTQRASCRSGAVQAHAPSWRLPLPVPSAPGHALSTAPDEGLAPVSSDYQLNFPSITGPHFVHGTVPTNATTTATATGGMVARRAPGACPARYLCTKDPISSPKFILT